MAWNSLVSGATGEGTQQGPQRRIQFLETENEALYAELRDLKLSRDNLLQSVSDQERIRVGLQRELTKLKGNLKYEKTAREGSSKRGAAYELECVSLREERGALATEQKINRRRLEELSSTLNQERMKRLRDLHLNEVLRKQNVALEESIKLVGADSVSANQRLLDKVLQADSAVAKSEVQRRIIDAQAMEILEVTREVTVATEKYKQAQERIGEMEIALARKTKEVLDLEAEVWRLRREVTALAGASHSRQHVAFGRSYEPHASFSLPSRRTRNENELRSLSEDILARAPGPVGSGGSVSSGGSLFGPSLGQGQAPSRGGRPGPESGGSVSLLSASLSEHLPSGGRPRPSVSGGAGQPLSPGASSVFSATTPFSPSRHTAPPGQDGSRSGVGSNEASLFMSKDISSKRIDTRLVGGGIFGNDSEEKPTGDPNERSSRLASRPRSIYVGQGLGLRADEEPAFNPKGSAKLVLKDILRQHELENG